jgi:hypothetical protein
MEYQTIGRADAPDLVEFGGLVLSDGRLPAESRGQIRGDCGLPIEPRCAGLWTCGLPVQWAGSLSVAADAPTPLELAAVSFTNEIGLAEWIAVQSIRAEIAVEHLRNLLVHPGFCAEFPNYCWSLICNPASRLLSVGAAQHLQFWSR